MSPTPSSRAHSATEPWPIRAVIVATFELDDGSGELQLWTEREHLTEVIPFSGGAVGLSSPHPLRTNPEHTLLGIVSGTTLVNATASLMALGLDPRFDLTHAYILISGIGGIDPRIASIGSVAWANFVVNGVGRQIDSREAPLHWPYGTLPSGATEPNPATLPSTPWARSNLYTLNSTLTAWAFNQTKHLSLADDPAIASFRSGFANHPNAQRPPFVLIGATLSSDLRWYGEIMTQFARDWVRLHTQGEGAFATSAMEDAGFMNAIERLHAMKRVDANRVMVLRAASNYTQQHPGQTAAESLAAPFLGMRLALQSAYFCGSTVLHALLADWDDAFANVPGV